MTRSDEILHFIDSYKTEHGYAPTIREIGAGVGLASPSTVHGHLVRMEKKGLIKRKELSSRAIAVKEMG